MHEDDEGHPDREPDPDEVLWERLTPLARQDITEPDLPTLLDDALAGTGWQVRGHRVVRSPEITPTYEVVVLHDPAPSYPGYGGPQWAVLAFPVAQPFAQMSGAERAKTIADLPPMEIGTLHRLVPWLMPPDLSMSHLPSDHPAHKQPPDPPPPLWTGHPGLGWNRLRELAALAVLLDTVRTHDPEQADTADALVARHPRGALVADYRRAIGTDR